MISNSTPLICLAKLNKLELLIKLFKQIIIPEAVKEEVLIEGKPGYSILNEYIIWGLIKIENPKNNLDFGIGTGENAAINLAKEKKDKLLIDDSFAIKIAQSLDIDYIRTTGVILLLLKKKIIDKKTAKEMIYALVEDGYYISPKILSGLIKNIESF